MRSECFLDTNVLPYAAAGKARDLRKFEIASKIVAERAFGLSAQVLAEFYVNFARRAATASPSMDVDQRIDVLTRFPTAPVDESLVPSEITVARRYQIHYYDAAIIVAAAERLGAAVLYTEDLNHGQRYGSVSVENPFL